MRLCNKKKGKNETLITKRDKQERRVDIEYVIQIQTDETGK